jgi:hypothetical protein
MPYLRNIICFLKETLHKDLSTLAKAAFDLLEWRIFWEPHLQEAVSVILSSANDSNWRTRSAMLTYLRIFMHRYGTSYRGFLLHHVLPCSHATDSRELAFCFFVFLITFGIQFKLISLQECLIVFHTLSL